MRKATPNPENLVTPEVAAKIWAEWLPDAPESGLGLLRRTERGTGPPCHMSEGRRMYAPFEVMAWCRSQQPEKVKALVAALHREAEVVVIVADNSVAATEHPAALYLSSRSGQPILRVVFEETGKPLHEREAKGGTS